MTKPVITTRAGKGSALTWTEGDTNLTNLRDATITVKAGTSGTDVVSDLNGTVTLVAGTNVTLSGDNTAKTVTINAAGGSTSPAGSNQQIQFNNSGSFGASSGLTYDGVSLKVAGNLESTYQNGDEGGEIFLKNAATNTTITNGVTIDVYQNKLRFFENGGSGRGYYVDITSGGNSAGTNLSSGGGIASVSADTAPALGGNLEVGTYSIIADTGDYIRLGNPNTMLGKTSWTGSVYLSTDQSTMVIGPDVQGNYAGGSKIQLNKGADGAITLTSIGAGNINLTPSGTGKVVAKQLNYNEGAIYDLGTTGGTIAPNVTNGNVQKITLNSALTMNAFTSPVAGQSLTLIIYGGTSYTSITSTMKFAGGIKTLTGTAGCIDILSVYYDGTTYFASLGKGFA